MMLYDSEGLPSKVFSGLTFPVGLVLAPRCQRCARGGFGVSLLRPSCKNKSHSCTCKCNSNKELFPREALGKSWQKPCNRNGWVGGVRA